MTEAGRSSTSELCLRAAELHFDFARSRLLATLRSA